MGQFSNAQLVTLKNAIDAETDVTFVALRTSGATGAMAEWYNGDSATLAWSKSVAPIVADDAPDYSTFDAVQAGKRDSWGFFLAFARDYSRNKTRKWVTDVWGNATAASNAEAILLAGTRNAKRGELVFGGGVKTTGTVSATDLTWTGSMRSEDIIAALGGSY